MMKKLMTPINLACILAIVVIIFLDARHIYSNVFLNIFSYVLIFYVAYSIPKKTGINS
ncbi:MAG: hypothetical protein ACRC41_04315 [Sarcina sp.]